MKEVRKILWINDEDKVISFHEADKMYKYEDTETKIWALIKELVKKGYKIM